MGRVDAAEVFYREWDARAPGASRSLPRARALAEVLGVLAPGVPVLTVVGSKGKGTAATYASAFLAAAGLRVCTVTSPGLRDDRDRIRVGGRAVSGAELASLGERLGRAAAALPPGNGMGGYLSPAGLFTLAGVLHARDAAADVIVLEAGMGGRSDEVSLFPPEIAAITPVFREHVGVLGETAAEIALEKLGVAGPATRAVLSAPQSAEVAEALAGRVEYVGPGGAEVPPDLLPAGLGRVSAELGIAAARRLAAPHAGEPSAERLHAVLATVTLPGRLSWHAVPGTATTLLADSAIDRTGVAAALAAARDRWGTIDRAVVCLPDHKDLDGAVAELGDVPVTFVRLPLPHLRFTRALPPGWDVVGLDAVTPASLGTLGHHLVVLGTVYFVGHVLGVVGADTRRLFNAEASPRPGGPGA
ncbi:hypothetical protein [Actinomadura fibrosa]|uniref:Uncharacterized protein n=1 Tax=Actinomadura fibrosa TaxID=111802 RepID=A0ABW2XQ23_9ACTN|nr:hypothetical protein [Actinomadura fibrosa]